MSSDRRRGYTRSRQTLDLLNERGAVLVFTCVALLGLLGFSALVVDYGTLWTARRQAQNAADAGAMAAAVSMAYTDMGNQGLARTAAINTARTNLIWGQQPDITNADVTFPVCPPGSPGAGTSACVRVDVFRNQRANGNPLQTIFGRLFGVNSQGVKATATAEVLFGDTATCVKPWAIPDKWIEHRGDVAPSGWDPEDEFERYGSGGALLNPADFYEPPGPNASNNGNGTGFTRESVAGSDYGLQLTLKTGNDDKISSSWHYPVVLDCTGGNCYRDAISGCSTRVVGPGTVLEVEPGNMVGPTKHGVDELIDLDPGAHWDPTMNNGRGGIAGGCMGAGTCLRSPRLVAIPVFNVDTFQLGKQNGRVDIVITKVLGFFIEGSSGNHAETTGRLMTYPSEPRPGAISSSPGTAFVVSIALVR
jgi:Flp pilus assembly protein TadG